jgi:hypothetical protein
MRNATMQFTLYSYHYVRLPRLLKRYTITAVAFLNATPIIALNPLLLITRLRFNQFLITTRQISKLELADHSAAQSKA